MSISREDLEVNLRDINSLLEVYQATMIVAFLKQVLPKQTLSIKDTTRVAEPSLGLLALLEPDQGDLSLIDSKQLNDLIDRFLKKESVKAIEPGKQLVTDKDTVKEQMISAISEYVDKKRRLHIDSAKGSEKFAVYIQRLESMLTKLPEQIEIFVDAQLKSDPVLTKMVEAKAKVKTELVKTLAREKDELSQQAQHDFDKAVKAAGDSFERDLEAARLEAARRYPRTPHDSSPILASDAKEREDGYKKEVKEKEIAFKEIKDAEIENAEYEYKQKIDEIDLEFQLQSASLDDIKVDEPSDMGSSLDRTMPGEFPSIHDDTKLIHTDAARSWGSTIPAEGLPGIARAGDSTETAAAEVPRGAIGRQVTLEDARKFARGLDSDSSGASTPASSRPGSARPRQLAPMPDRPVVSPPGTPVAHMPEDVSARPGSRRNPLPPVPASKPPAFKPPPPESPVSGVIPPSGRSGCSSKPLPPLPPRESDGPEKGPSRRGPSGRGHS